jgi:sporulation protein YlmC with PRC-barrel domain
VSARTVSLDDLVGRVVHDADGRRIGRIEELEAEIALERRGNEYVVTRFGVGRWGPLDTIASARILQQLVRRIMRATSYVRYDIPWDWMDLSDLAHPRVLRREQELPRTGSSED